MTTAKTTINHLFSQALGRLATHLNNLSSEVSAKDQAEGVIVPTYNPPSQPADPNATTVVSTAAQAPAIASTPLKLAKLPNELPGKKTISEMTNQNELREWGNAARLIEANRRMPGLGVCLAARLVPSDEIDHQLCHQMRMAVVAAAENSVEIPAWLPKSKTASIYFSINPKNLVEETTQNFHPRFSEGRLDVQTARNYELLTGQLIR